MIWPAACAARSGSFSPMRSDDRGRGEGDADRHGVDERHDRLCEADDRHRLPSQARHPEHIDDGEQRLHDHLEDHGHGEQKDCTIQRLGRVVVLLALEREPYDAPEPEVLRRGRSSLCGRRKRVWRVTSH
jgi:hypothetical protein